MLDALWARHLAQPFPADCRGREVVGIDLVQLDADVSECVQTYLATRALAPEKREMLVRCIAELERVVPALEGEAREYFRLLEALAGILLHHCQADAPAA
jgi:hypothetical protein